MAMYGAELKVQVGDGPISIYGVALKAATEEAARKALLRREAKAVREAYPNESLDIEILSIVEIPA